MDRRGVFFLLAAAISALLIPLVPHDPKHLWLHRTPFVLIGGLVFLAIVSFLDHWSSNRS